MNAIKKLKLDISIRKALDGNANILGICLGYQMLFQESEEFGINKGLGILEGKVISLKNFSKKNDRVPNVGWRPLIINNQNKLLSRSYENKMVYFVHSFIPQAKKISQVSTYIKFGKEKIHSSIHCDNIVGFQFHPEKSGVIGLNILKDTINYLLKKQLIMKKLINIERVSISCNKTVFQAMETINNKSIPFLIITNKNKELLGTITDGDIRRFILRGNDLSQSVKAAMNKKPVYCFEKQKNFFIENFYQYSLLLNFYPFSVLIKKYNLFYYMRKKKNKMISL